MFINFLLVDRFDKDQANLPAYDPAFAPTGRDPAEGRVFQGGNLKGIIRRLDYIQGPDASLHASRSVEPAPPAPPATL